ncbi:MAG: RDD family protein [Clostridia bacterium]|nr:RDD family protein [Clostridia bacterium]
MYDFQKANIWKRISASLFDIILLVIIIIGLGLLTSRILKYDSLSTHLQDSYSKYEEAYGIDLSISQEEYDTLDEASKAKIEAARKAILEDKDIIKTYEKLMNFTLIIITFSILFAYLLLEFVVPLLFKNGQTLGKKVFGVAVMREDGVRLSSVSLFIRTVLGKYTIETMIPVMVLILFFFGTMNIFCILVVGALLIIQLTMFIIDPARSLIHDKIAKTVCVDLASQMIFDSENEMLEFKKRVQAEKAARAEY